MRGAASEEGLALQLMKHCVGDDVDEQLTDDMIDEVFMKIDDDGGGTLSADEVAGFLEAEGLGGGLSAAELFEVLKQQFGAGQSVTDSLVQMSAKHVALLKKEMVQFILHSIAELAAGMSGLGRQQMIQRSNGGVLRILNQGLMDKDTTLRVTALQGLHALLSNRFALEDVMADDDFEGFYADVVELASTAVSVPDEIPNLMFENLTAVQRRKLHIIAEFAGMRHESYGPPDARCVVVTPKQTHNDKLHGDGITLSATILDTVAEEVDGAGLTEPEDPWDPKLYAENRAALCAQGVIPTLTKLAEDPSAEVEVSFNALDVLVLLAKYMYDAIPAEQAERLDLLFRETVCRHPNMGVAVLAAWALEHARERRGELPGLQPGPRRCYRAVRVVVTVLKVHTAMKDVSAGGVLDQDLARSRAALR